MLEFIKCSSKFATAASTSRFSTRHKSSAKRKPTCSSSPGTSNLETLGKCQLEFTSGVGGQEAMMFSNDLFEMYRKYAQRMGWIWQPLEVDRIQFLGMGLRSAIVSVTGPLCYQTLRFEGGVHRVQRVPLTDKTRMHTSTASLVVMPEPENPDLFFGPKDLKIELCKGSGPGGSNVNANPTSVRMTHVPTGISVKVMDERYEKENRKLALQRLSAILLQREVEELGKRLSSTRKLQIGSLARAEKIRTYNFKDNRITDHRLQYTIKNVEDFMDGGSGLETFLTMLRDLFITEENTAKEAGAQIHAESDNVGNISDKAKRGKLGHNN